MLDRLVGGSPALKKLRSAVPRLASDPAPILIVGETGVGKSLFASHVHDRSRLRAAPPQTINFAVLSERDQGIALLGGGPAELTTTRKSLLEHPTTVVIKHVDRASAYLQEKLAEAIKSRRIHRPGTSDVNPLACRIIFTITAGHDTLHRSGRIIPSLFEIFDSCESISIPPLRKRGRDIPLLAEHFLHTYYDKLHSSIDGQMTYVQALDERGKIKSDLADLLIDQTWPGNVLQLKAFIHSIITPSYDYALLQTERIELSKMLFMLDEGREFSLRESISIIEDAIIRRAMAKLRGQQKPAQLLGLTGRSIRRRL